MAKHGLPATNHLSRTKLWIEHPGMKKRRESEYTYHYTRKDHMHRIMITKVGMSLFDLGAHNPFHGD